MKLYQNFKGAIVVFLILSLALIAAGRDEFPITAKDGFGRTVTVESAPQKIISTVPSNTEILYDLGLKDKVIAVTSHCAKTCDTSEKSIIGGWSEPGIAERIEELRPDLVLAFGGLQSPLAKEMDKKGIPTFVFFPKTVDETLEQIIQVGKITGSAQTARAIVRRNRDKLREIEEKLENIPLEKRVKCLRLMSTQAMVIGGTSFQSDIIRKAGGINIFGDIEDDYPIVTLDDVREKDPDIIVFNRDDEKKAIEQFLKEEGWRDLRAAREGGFASISCDYICHPNTRIAETVAMLVRRFYPERFPLTLTDATNRTIKFSKKPRHIISLNPSATEILYALNVKESMAGVTQFCPFPELLDEKENIGTILDPDVEKIISLKPDLVFATVEGNKKTSIDNLRRAGAKVFVLDEIHSFDDIEKRINTMGEMLREQRESDQLILGMKRKIDSIRQKVEKKKRLKVFLQLGRDPIVTVNKNTIMNDAILLAGGENIAKDASIRYPRYSIESVVARNPDAIIVASMGKYGEGALKKWRTYKSLKAVRDDRMRVIDSNLICHMGPRLVEGVEEIAKFLHPEVFREE